MVRRRLLFGAAAIVALAGGRPAAAGPISFATGDAEKDMPSSQSGVLTIVNRATPTSPSVPSQPDYMTQEGRVNGWLIKDMRVYYDQPDDRLYVGVNFFGIAGDVDGNGVVGTTDPRFTGIEEKLNMGSNSWTDSTITVGIDLTNSGTPTIVAGLSSDKTVQGPGTDGFSVNKYNAQGGLGMSYGESLNAHNLNLAFDPSADHPDFLFSIGGVSQLPGFDMNSGLGFVVHAGSSYDDRVGEEDLNYTHVDFQQIVPPPPSTPEPTTVLAWSVVVGGAAWRGAKRRRKGKGGPSVA